MKLNDLESYREDGFINMDKVLLEHPELAETILRETRGTESREKDWIKLEDCSILLRTEIPKNPEKNLKGSGKYSIYSELLIKELADQVGIPAAYYDLITYKGQKGVLSKKVTEKEEETLILYRTLLAKLNLDTSDPHINLEDLFRSNKFLKYDGIENETLFNIMEDICKVVMFDILTSNHDRNRGNIGIIYNSEEKTARLSPIFDNEQGLGGNLTDYELAFNQSFTPSNIMRAPKSFSDEFRRCWSYYRKVMDIKTDAISNWQILAAYIIDDDDSLGIKDLISDFCSDCFENIDLQSAFKNVEQKIKCELPSEFKNLAETQYNNRKNYVEKALGLDYDYTNEIDTKPNIEMEEL